METAEEPTYQIFVMTLTGQTITLLVKASDTIAVIKDKIADRLNLIFMQPSDYYLTFQSRRMEAGRTLSDYNILAENTLYMNGRVRGGADVDMEDIDISTISDADIINEIVHRQLGLKVLQQYPWTETLATIPDASSPQASLLYSYGLN